MISLINLTEDKIISAQEPVLSYIKSKPITRVGYQKDLDEDENKIKRLFSTDVFIEECIKKNGKYYKNQKDVDNGNPLKPFQLFISAAKDTKFEIIKKGLHLVDLVVFARYCPFSFTVVESIDNE